MLLSSDDLTLDVDGNAWDELQSRIMDDLFIMRSRTERFIFRP